MPLLRFRQWNRYRAGALGGSVRSRPAAARRRLFWRGHGPPDREAHRGESRRPDLAAFGVRPGNDGSIHHPLQSGSAQLEILGVIAALVLVLISALAAGALYQRAGATADSRKFP